MKKENEKNNNNNDSIDRTKRNNDNINIKETKTQENNDKISINECNIQNDNESEQYNNKYCLNEKKIIIYLIILSLALIYYSLFFIHNINFRGVIKDTQLVEIKHPQNNNDANNSIDVNNPQENTMANIIANNNTNSITNNNITNGILGNNIGNGNSNNNVNNNTGNGEINNPGGSIVDNKDRFKIMQGTENWKDLKTLDIFNNYYFNDHSIIAPGVSGEYSFTVENYRETNMKYNLNFIEQNIYNINMVYKLKLNGSYIAGDEQRYVKYQELNKEDLIINTNTSDIITIEWKWQDNNNDTQIGKIEGSNYKMSIRVDAFDLEKN